MFYSTELTQSPPLDYTQGLAYKGTWDCVKRVYREEGFRGFYKGLTASYLGKNCFLRPLLSLSLSLSLIYIYI